MGQTHMVEVKVSLGGAVEDAVRRLRLGAARARTLYFFEQTGPSSSHALLDAGIILRLRVDDDGGDVTAKLRPCRRRQLHAPWQRPTDLDEGARYTIEGDWAGARQVLAAAVVVPLTPVALLGALQRPAGVLSAGQWAFLDRCAAERVDPDALVARGPVSAHRWPKFTFGKVEEVVAERWRVADLDFLELSVRVPVADAVRTQQQLHRAVQKAGLTLDQGGPTKTDQVLGRLALAHV